MSILRTCYPCSLFLSSPKRDPSTTSLPLQTTKAAFVFNALQKQGREIEQYLRDQKKLGMNSPLVKGACRALVVGGAGLVAYYVIPAIAELASSLFSQSDPVPRSQPIPASQSEVIQRPSFSSDRPSVQKLNASNASFAFQDRYFEGFHAPVTPVVQPDREEGFAADGPLSKALQNDSAESSLEGSIPSEKESSLTIEPPLISPKDAPNQTAQSGWLNAIPFALLIPALVASPAKNGDGEVVGASGNFQKNAQKIVRLLPYLGLGCGFLLGLSTRESLSYKSADACRAGFSSSPFLETINGLKQLELKRIAYLTPLVLPATFNIGTRVFGKKEAGDSALAEKVNTAWLTFMGLGLATPSLTRLISSPISGYKLSGHFLLKTVCAGLLSSGGSALSQKIAARFSERVARVGQAALALYVATYAISDAVFLANTASHCHTVAEVALGITIGALLVKSSQSAGTRFVRLFATG